MVSLSLPSTFLEHWRNYSPTCKYQARELSLAKQMIQQVRRSNVCLLILVTLYLVGNLNPAESLDSQVNTCSTSSCVCKWSNGKQGASCERRNLKTIPTLPSETQVLDVSGNNITHLTPHIFQERHLTNLQKLYLSECKLAYIADEAFEQLTNLVELDLSHNQLKYVPSKALKTLKYSLRKLSLAFNQIHIIESDAFNHLSHLNTLDLTHSQVMQLRPGAFSGLSDLRELKLSENNLSQLPLNAIADLRRNLMIEIHSNPYHCDCELRQSIEWMQRHQIQPVLNPTCASPPRHKNIHWQNIKPAELLCPPVILNKPEEHVVGAGSNITLSCSASGSQPLTFVWFQDEKNLTTGSSDQPSTKLLEERRYEIQEEITPPNVTTSMLFLMNLKLTDTSVFLCWVENGAGYSMGNFSLVVNDSPPTNMGIESTILGAGISDFFGLSQNKANSLQIGLFALILLLSTLAIIFYFVQSNSRPKARELSESPPSKTDDQEKTQKQMFASDEDITTDDESSQSFCASRGNTRVMAAAELDGFIDYMRSGIINMDYHSMSPVIQFNQQKQQLQDPPQQHHIPQQQYSPQQIQLPPQHLPMQQIYPDHPQQSNQLLYQQQHQLLHPQQQNQLIHAQQQNHPQQPPDFMCELYHMNYV